MITITRQQARRLRGVFRRSVLGIYHRDPVPPLVFRASASAFRVEFQYQGRAVVYIEPGHETYIDDTIALPLEGLTDIEGSGQTPVALLSATFEKTVATYVSVGAERKHEYDVPPVWTLEPFPELPSGWKPVPASLVTATTTFAKAQGDDTTTDPINEGKRSPATLALSRLLGGQVLWLGKTPSHLAVRSGPWTILVREGVPVRVRTRLEPRPGRSAAKPAGKPHER